MKKLLTIAPAVLLLSLFGLSDPLRLAGQEGNLSSTAAPVVSPAPAPSSASVTPAALHTFEVGTESFLLDGKPFVIRCGEIHMARVPKEYWRHRLQMCRAMGLNTVCLYLFWNFHEWEQGKFDWSGDRDAAEFCRIAQEEGLWVLLRPGPYTCAEWEMGGLPWWLLKKDNTKDFLRTRDPEYMKPCQAWLEQMGRILAPFQINRGGPILMVQVENEYGYFGHDVKYMQEQRQLIVDAGFTIPTFVCNPGFALKDGLPQEFLKVVNFGSNAPEAFKALRAAQPNRPLMCGEFYPGWFDMWGQPHNTGNMKSYLSDMEYMLKNKASFSIYMAHGGTSFGLWAGSVGPKPGNLAFRPDTSSYDYDAPISEAGWVTPKFQATRELFSRYMSQEEKDKLPEPPAKIPVITIAPVQLKEYARLWQNLPAPVADTEPRPMEKYGQGRGCILYRTTLPAGPAARLEAASVRDFAWVYLDGTEIGRMDRRYRVNHVDLPARIRPVQLDILVEAMGRTNFGIGMYDRKGLHSPVLLKPKTGAGEPAQQQQTLRDWQVFNLGLEPDTLGKLKWEQVNPAASESGKPLQTKKGQPAFWRGTLPIATPGDTFLDVSNWGKGVVWINGRCLGRFWNIGPTQTMYLPGPWLRAGNNEVIVLDIMGPADPQQAVLAGLAEPILSRLRLELDFKIPSLADRTELLLKDRTPVHRGAFTDSAQPDVARFAQPVEGRQVAFEMLSSQDGKPSAAISELNLVDEAGKDLPRDKWTIAYVDSEELSTENAPASGAIDGSTGQREEFWHSEWSRRKAPYPHCLVVDLGENVRVAGIRYTPRAGSKSGRVKDYCIYIGDKLAQPKEPAAAN